MPSPKFLRLTAFVATALLATPAFAQGLYSSVEALWLDRESTDHVVAFFDGDSANHPNEPALSANRFSFDLQVGPRLTLGKDFGNGTAIEGTYFGLQHWSSGAVVVDPAENLQPSFLSGGNTFDDFEDAFSYVADYSSELHSVEVNLRRQVRPNASVTFGARYARLEETFNLSSFDEDPSITTTDVGFWSSNTENDLIGLQIGGEMNFMFFDFLTVGFDGRAGMYLNFISNDFSISNHGFNQQEQPTVTSIKDRENEEALASIVEVGMNVGFVVRPGIEAAIGYDVMMLNGVALAIEQQINSVETGTLVLYGPSARIIFRR